MRMWLHVNLVSVIIYALSFTITGTLIVVFFFPKSMYEKQEDARSYEVVDTFDLKDILSTPTENRVIIDLRTGAQFHNEHIPGSVNLHEPWLVSDIMTKTKADGTPRQIIIMNLRRDQNKSLAFYRLLKGLNIPQVAIYSGGWEEWKSCELPTESNHE